MGSAVWLLVLLLLLGMSWPVPSDRLAEEGRGSACSTSLLTTLGLRSALSTLCVLVPQFSTMLRKRGKGNEEDNWIRTRFDALTLQLQKDA
jgi:hypothetical protein